MRIGVDATAVLDELTGAEVHTLAAVDALRRHPAGDEEVVLFVRRRAPEGWRDLPDGWRVEALASDSQAVATQALLPVAAARAGVDVLYCPAKPAPALARVRLLVNIHDVIPWTRASAMGTRRAVWWYRGLHRAAVARRAHVATVSEASAAAIRRTLGVAEDRLHVVGNTVAPWLAAAAGRPRRRPRAVAGHRYLMALSRLDPRRDLDTVLDAWETVSARHPDTRLVVAGGIGWKVGPTVRRAQSTPGVVLTGRLGNDELADLYCHAEALVSASREEGFGLPLIEAFSFGVPALASAIPAHLEVGGDAALYFAPGDAAGLGRAMDEVLSCPRRREELAAAARPRAERFDALRLAGRLRRALAAATA